MNKPISDFSRAFSHQLRGYMVEREITVRGVAAQLPGRSHAFVSERTNGTRPPDTDIIDAVARLAQVEPRSLTAVLVQRMEDGFRPRGVTPDEVEAARSVARGVAAAKKRASSPGPNRTSSRSARRSTN